MKPCPSCKSSRSNFDDKAVRRGRVSRVPSSKPGIASAHFCRYDRQLGSSAVGLEAAHVRWFNLGGTGELNNGMALCSLHHKLFDRGALGLDEEYRILISSAFSARTEAAKRIYDLQSRPLRPRRGTDLPAVEHVPWHGREVFRGQPLSV